MKIGIVLYDKVNLLNFAQISDFVRGLEGARVKTYALKPEIVDEVGLRLHPEIYAESLYGLEAIIVPDGIGALSLRYDEIFLSWIKGALGAKFKIGLDLGVLILGGAGFLKGREAAIRGGYKNALSEYCEFIDAKMCDSDGVISICELNSEVRNALSEILK